MTDIGSFDCILINYYIFLGTGNYMKNKNLLTMKKLVQASEMH